MSDLPTLRAMSTTEQPLPDPDPTEPETPEGDDDDAEAVYDQDAVDA